MPPKRQRTELSTDRVEQEQPTNEVPSKRVTRSSTRLSDSSAPPVAVVAPTKAKKGKKPQTTIEGNSSISEVDNVANAKVIIVEHCTQCNRIKRRALEAKAGLEEAARGVKVLINPEKPRRGCFEIRTDGGEIFLSIQGLKRPFKPLMDVNMTEVIADVVAKLPTQE